MCLEFRLYTDLYLNKSLKLNKNVNSLLIFLKIPRNTYALLILFIVICMNLLI